MPNRPSGEVRALALVGPTGSGKTTLMEAMLQAAGETDRKVGDSSPEAKARGHSVEMNLAGFNFMGEHYTVVDCPGSLELAAESDAALPAVDLAVIVTEPDAAFDADVEPSIDWGDASPASEAVIDWDVSDADGTTAAAATAVGMDGEVPELASAADTAAWSIEVEEAGQVDGSTALDDGRARALLLSDLLEVGTSATHIRPFSSFF